MFRYYREAGTLASFSLIHIRYTIIYLHHVKIVRKSMLHIHVTTRVMSHKHTRHMLAMIVTPFDLAMQFRPYRCR